MLVTQAMVFALLGVLAMAAAGAPSMLACVSRASAATINSAMIFTVKLSPRGRARASVRADARIRTGARLLLVAQKGTAAAMACLATIRSNERWSCEASCTPAPRVRVSCNGFRGSHWLVRNRYGDPTVCV